MAPNGSPYPPMPGETDFAQPFDDDHLHKLESPDYDVKDESESPTNIQYLKRYSQVVKASGSSPIATDQKLEYFDTGDTSQIITGNDYQLPAYQSSSRPFSYPLGSTSSYLHPVNNPFQAQPRRPHSYVGTADDPYRMQYVQPTPTTAGSVYLPPQSRPLDPYEDVFASHPNPASAPLQYLLDAPVEHDVEEHNFTEDDADSNEGSGSGEGSDEDEDDTEELPMLPGTQQKTKKWPDTIFDFDGYPDHDQDPPADLSCYEVCQRYPAALMHENLLPFIQRRWSADEIFDCLPLDIQQGLHSREVKQKPNYLVKRIQKLENKLRGIGSSGKGGPRDYTAYLALLNGPRMRDDGRPAHVQKNQSAAAPNRVWRKRKGVGIDPDTGLYVETASQPQARSRALMEAAPAHALMSQVAAPSQGTQLRPQPNTLRLRQDRRKPTPRGRSATTASPTPVNTTRRGRPSRSTTTNLPPIANAVPSHARPNRTAAFGTAGPAPYDIAQAACTPPPQQPSVGNLSDIREPTLASMFPDGMIDMCGAYVRTVSPNGTSMWHGAPSAEFIEKYTGQGKFRFWMDVNLPQQYRPDAAYPPMIAADEPATFRTGVADWLDLEDITLWELPHEKEARDKAERDAKLKRKAKVVNDGDAEDVGREVKKARTAADAAEAAKKNSPDEATQAIMQVMDPESPKKAGDGGSEAAADVDVADDIAGEADEEAEYSTEDEAPLHRLCDVATEAEADEDEAEPSHNGLSEHDHSTSHASQVGAEDMAGSEEGSASGRN